MKTNINRNLPNENYEAAISANGPTVANPYATLADVSAGTPTVQYGRSVWLHLCCPHCGKWFAVEDDIPPRPFCPHCGDRMELAELGKSS